MGKRIYAVFDRSTGKLLGCSRSSYYRPLIEVNGEYFPNPIVERGLPEWVVTTAGMKLLERYSITIDTTEDANLETAPLTVRERTIEEMRIARKVQVLTKIFKYQPINKNSLAGLYQEKFWASKAACFNDPFEFRLKRSSTPRGLVDFRRKNEHLNNLNNDELLSLAISDFENIFAEMGVVCYTKSPDNILMWSHYADGHKGMCPEFQLNEGQTLDDVAIYEVAYEQNYPEIDFEYIWCAFELSKVLRTKSKEWESEKELRLIRIPGGNELIDYPVGLSGIIFGLRTPESEKALIR